MTRAACDGAVRRHDGEAGGRLARAHLRQQPVVGRGREDLAHAARRRLAGASGPLPSNTIQISASASSKRAASATSCWRRGSVHHCARSRPRSTPACSTLKPSTSQSEGGGRRGFHRCARVVGERRVAPLEPGPREAEAREPRHHEQALQAPRQNVRLVGCDRSVQFVGSAPARVSACVSFVMLSASSCERGDPILAGACDGAGHAALGVASPEGVAYPPRHDRCVAKRSRSGSCR